MRTNLPWDGLSVPASGYVWKKSAECEKHVFWWGKNSAAHPVLMFQLNQDHIPDFKNARPRVNGLDIDMVSVESGKHQGLIITLSKASDADLFHRLCLSLIQAAEGVETEAQAVQSVLNNLDRWREFLSAARRAVLSAEEIRGLYAELITINNLIDDYGRDPSEIVSAWQGPLGKSQDFQFPSGYLEVKSIGGTAGNRVKISSEHQLDVVGGFLYLAAVELFENQSSDAGTSLNDLARRTEARLEIETAKLFRDRLMVGGYIDRGEYDLPLFETGKTLVYKVDDGFPSIRASDLPQGVANVRYGLDLNSAQPFRVPKIMIWEDAANDR